MHRTDVARQFHGLPFQRIRRAVPAGHARSARSCHSPRRCDFARTRSARRSAASGIAAASRPRAAGRDASRIGWQRLRARRPAAPGVNSRCPISHGAAGRREHPRIGGLVLVERMRQRHQDRGPPDDRELGDRRGAGARDHELGRRHAGRQVARRRARSRPRRRRRDRPPTPFDVLGARLLHDRQARAQSAASARSPPARSRP